MAKMTLTNGSLVVNSVDLSNRVRSMTLNYEAEMLDASTMGVGSTRSTTLRRRHRPRIAPPV